VNQICLSIVQGHRLESYKENGFNMPPEAAVATYPEAVGAVSALLRTVDWTFIRDFSCTPPGITQTELPRVPIDVSNFYDNAAYRAIIIDSLGIDEEKLQTI